MNLRDTVYRFDKTNDSKEWSEIMTAAVCFDNKMKNCNVKIYDNIFRRWTISFKDFRHFLTEIEGAQAPQMNTKLYAVNSFWQGLVLKLQALVKNAKVWVVKISLYFIFVAFQCWTHDN